MTEREYLIATNRVKVSMALSILRDVLPGEEYGISGQCLSEIASLLEPAEERLFSLLKISEQ